MSYFKRFIYLKDWLTQNKYEKFSLRCPLCKDIIDLKIDTSSLQIISMECICRNCDTRLLFKRIGAFREPEFILFDKITKVKK